MDEFVKRLMGPPPPRSNGIFDSLKKLVNIPQQTILKTQNLMNDYNRFQDYQRQQNMKKLLPAPAVGSGRRKKKIKKVKFQ